MTLEPYAGAAWVGVNVDGFTEQGGAAALSARAGHTATTLTTLGLRFDKPFDFGGVAARLAGGIGWQHAFGQLAPTSDLSFSGGTPFTVAGTPRAADLLKLDIGLNAVLGPRTTGSLNYSGEIGSGTQDHALTGRVTIGF
jgi:subtilase-type serine protease